MGEAKKEQTEGSEEPKTRGQPPEDQMPTRSNTTMSSGEAEAVAMKRARAEALRLAQTMEECGLWRTQEVYVDSRTAAEATQDAESRWGQPMGEGRKRDVENRGEGEERLREYLTETEPPI